MGEYEEVIAGLRVLDETTMTIATALRGVAVAMLADVADDEERKMLSLKYSIDALGKILEKPESEEEEKPDD
jgi:hypothetical protein